MAYDQNQYQAPSRPYNGRAAAPPAQVYNQQASYSQYESQDQYNQYPQDDGYDYGGDGYNDGYGQQDYGYQQSQYNNGRGNGSRAPDNYGAQQGQYQEGSGGRGGPESRRRGDPNGNRPYNGQQGGYGQSRGAPQQKGGRPPPPERSTSSDPGNQRRAPHNHPMSPQEVAWDNPFPGFPGAKKKTSNSEENRIVQGMANMDMNGSARPRTAGGSRPDGSRRPPPPGASFGNGRPSGGPPRGPPGGYSQHNGPGYGGPRPSGGQGQRGPPPRQNTYNNAPNDQGYGQSTSPGRDEYSQPPRSMTMPIDSYNRMQPPRYPPGDVGPSAPYNGPVGKMPPRPSTATGTRPNPQSSYRQDNAGPQTSGQQYIDSNQDQPADRGSIDDLYGDYFQESGEVNGTGRTCGHPEREHNGNNYQRGNSLDGGPMPPRQQVNGNQAMSRMKSQPDFRAQVQPQSAVYEMVGDAPPLPNGEDQGGRQGYDLQYNQYNNEYSVNGSGPNGHGVSSGYGQSRGPPAQGRGVYESDGFNNGNPSQRNGSSQQDQGLPSHPAPVRPGLVPGSVGNLASNKPTPVRNYGNTNELMMNTQNNVPPPQQQTQQPIQQNQAPQQYQSAPQPQAEIPPPVTLDEIERLKAIVNVNSSDANAQLTLARKWMEAADVLAPKIPDGRARTKARERYIMDAHKMLKKLCAGQNPYPEAQFFLADCYGRGALGLEPDNKEAFLLYQSAAKAGHAAAAYRTAVCCELGSEDGGGTRKDPLKAMQWYKRAATLGDTPAMYKMGIVLLKGLLGQPKDPRQAVGWLKRAAEHADVENPHALHELGLLYEAKQPPDGSGTIIRDEAYALSLFSQAAQLGYKFSQFRLGCAYEYGLMGCQISPRDSIMWYSRAAVQEEHQSELALSGWYLTGSEGVLGQSDTEAYLWARKAAMAGLAKAEYAMGYFTEVGIGSPSDLEGAKRWYWRAAAQNFPKARERLEDLKRGGSKPQLKSRERHSRSKVGKQNEGECSVM